MKAKRFLGGRYWGVLHEGYFHIVEDGNGTVSMKEVADSTEKCNKQEIIDEFSYFVEDVKYLMECVCYGHG
jgi:hypothetical protein